MSLWEIMELTDAVMIRNLFEAAAFLNDLRNDREAMLKLLGDMTASMPKIGLKLTNGFVLDLIRDLPSLNEQQITARLTEIERVSRKELEDVKFLFVSYEYAKIYEAKEPFGLATESFSDSQHDMREAQKCLGLYRSTAAVMHLMRCLESAIHPLGRRVGLTVSKADDAQKILNQTIAALEARKKEVAQQTRSQERNEELSFLGEAAFQLNNAKDAWRAQSMHPHAVWTLEEAKDIYDNVRKLMHLLAKNGLSDQEQEP